mmetsp:Transcript_39526/g.54875  ORF Transcript_39526/g.54875 Transcript_39526/m.54875 type:complete len:358 (-) Transcript_39526:18-1091(-)
MYFTCHRRLIASNISKRCDTYNPYRVCRIWKPTLLPRRQQIKNTIGLPVIRLRLSLHSSQLNAIEDADDDLIIDLESIDSNSVGSNEVVGLDKRARDGQQVAVHYTGTALETGETVQTTWDRQEGPMVYTLGSMQDKPADTPSARILKTFDMALLGMKEGSTKTVSMEAVDAWGIKDPNLVQVIPMATLKQAVGMAADTLKKGDNILLPDGRKVFVQEISETTCTVDFNHPLAGLDVDFELTLYEIGEPGEIMDCQKGMNMKLARVSHILVESEELCLDLKSRLDEDVDEFASLARTHSKCESAVENGSLGTVQAGMTVAEFDAVVFDRSIKTGTVCGPVKTDFGYHLILVHERISP